MSAPLEETKLDIGNKIGRCSPTFIADDIPFDSKASVMFTNVAFSCSILHKSEHTYSVGFIYVNDMFCL